MNDISIKRSFEVIYRTKQEDNKKIIHGYAVIFDSWAEIGSWDECIKKGAFTESLKNNKILALYNHDFNNVLARKDVNMMLIEDDRGLKFEIELPNTTQSNDLYELVNRGIVNQCSFSGFVRQEEWNYEDGERILRTINDIDLIEITITPIPAYDVTEAEVKRSKRIQEVKSETLNTMDFEQIIRESKEKLNKIKEYERSLRND